MSLRKRPLSPHLQIYRPQITSVLSILHRFAGILLAVGTLHLVYWIAAAAAGPEAFATAQTFTATWIGRLLLFGWTAAFFYHLANGIRHLVWDTGYGFELGTVTASGWTVVAATVVLTLISWAVGYGLIGGVS
ncbi:MAG: succinate dehydrogenase, cytochrome b556 subunit [Pseudomonadota bacterium]